MSMPRVLVAEDEFIVAYDLCDTVAEAGCLVEGPHGDLASAMLAAQKALPDLAILDIRLEDGETYPLAEKLLAERVPVIFHSGQFSVAEMNRRFPQAIACSKPCPPGELLARMREALEMRVAA